MEVGTQEQDIIPCVRSARVHRTNMGRFQGLGHGLPRYQACAVLVKCTPASLLLLGPSKDRADATLPLSDVVVVRVGQAPRVATRDAHDLDETAKRFNRIVQYFLLHRAHWIADGIQTSVSQNTPVIDEGSRDARGLTLADLRLKSLRPVMLAMFAVIYGSRDAPCRTERLYEPLSLRPGSLMPAAKVIWAGRVEIGIEPYLKRPPEVRLQVAPLSYTTRT
jgi:hypothetical protein